MPLSFQDLESLKFCEPFYAKQIAENRFREAELAGKRTARSVKLFLVAAAAMALIMNWQSWMPALIHWMNG